MALASGAGDSTPFIIKTKNNQFEGLTYDKEKDWQGPFFFIQGADTQLGMIESMMKKENPGWTEEIELCHRLIHAINRMTPKPKFFVVCGDLLDAYPDLYPERRALQEKDFKKVLAELNPEIPLVCVCGNHDVGEIPNPETVLKYRASFGDDFFSFWCGGVFFITINSQYYVNSSKIPEIKAEQDRWLDEQLSRIKTTGCKYAVVFQHIPWFLQTVDDPDNGIFSFNGDIRKEMLDKFQKAGVNAIFCGHFHRNAGGFYGPMEQVVTSAVGAQLGTDKSGARVVKILDNAIQHHYYAIEDLPATIPLASTE